MIEPTPDIKSVTRLPRVTGEHSLLLLRSSWVNFFLSLAEAFLNTKYYQQQTDGVNILPPNEADVKTSEAGRIVTFPAAGSSGGSGSTTASLVWLLCVNDLGSSLQCVSWNGSVAGTTPIYVAKPQEIRCGTNALITNTILGVVYNYAYSSQPDYNGMTMFMRAVTGGVTETDFIVPPYVANQEILAGGITPITLDGNLCSLIDLNVAGRAWGAPPSNA